MPDRSWNAAAINRRRLRLTVTTRPSATDPFNFGTTIVDGTYAGFVVHFTP